MKHMKFNRYLMMMLPMASLVLSSCDDKDSEGVSRVTEYPVFTLNGDERMFLKKGDTYTEPGASATEGETEIEVNIDYSGTYFESQVSSIDTQNPDIYNVTYSAVNKDGFPGQISRTVVVAGEGDMVNNLEGLYLATVVRTPGGGPATADYTDREFVVIRQVDADTYEISDGIGGYYDLGREYGPTYAAPTSFTANNIAANDFTFHGPFGVGLFGGEAEIKSMTVDPATKTITFTTEWDGTYAFAVTLKQVDF